MLGFSYGEVFLLLGATAALLGPKDLPIIARTVGRYAGRSIGYVQLARGQFDNIMQQSQAREVHKELQDTLSQLEAIRHEIRTISFINPGPLTRRLVDNVDNTTAPSTVEIDPPSSDKVTTIPSITPKDHNSRNSALSDMHSQAAAYARLAEATPLKSVSTDNEGLSEMTDESGNLIVLPVSAESAGLLPKRIDEAKGSDIVLEAILEAEVAQNAKVFFSQPENQIKRE